jgi:hypothetical protein
MNPRRPGPRHAILAGSHRAGQPPAGELREGLGLVDETLAFRGSQAPVIHNAERAKRAREA